MNSDQLAYIKKKKTNMKCKLCYTFIAGVTEVIFRRTVNLMPKSSVGEKKKSKHSGLSETFPRLFS